MGGNGEAPGRSSPCPDIQLPVLNAALGRGVFLGNFPAALPREPSHVHTTSACPTLSPSPHRAPAWVYVRELAAAPSEGKWALGRCFPKSLRSPPSAGGQEAVQGCGRILSPTPGFTTSVPPSVLRKVLRESLPLLETPGRQRRRGPSSGESAVNQRPSPQREQSVSTEWPHCALAHWGRTLSSSLHTET